MSIYKGKPAVVNKPANELYTRFSDMNALRDAMEKSGQLGNADAQLKFDDDSLSVTNPQVGEIKFQIVDRKEPEHVTFKAVNSPLPIGMTINIKPLDETSSEVSTDIDIELPMMLRAMLGSKMQQVADRFGDMMIGMSK